MPIQGSGSGDPHSNYPIDDPGNTNRTSSSDGDQTMDDLNLLLLLQPSKKVRDLAKLADSLENRGQMTEEARDSLQEFALTLINDPKLPPGTRDALARWMTALASFTTTQPTLTRDTDGDAKPDAPALLANGMDPEILLLDNPALKPTTRALGNVAKAMAEGQGGTLTMEQVNALIQQANNLLADPNLPQADREALQNFKNELLEYPIAEQPAESEGTTRTNNTLPTDGQPDTHELVDTNANPSGTQRSVGDRGGSGNTPPTPQSLLMDNPNLSTEVKDLGKSANSYATANGGPLTNAQVTQLKQLAQTLINAGAIDPDLAALQEFLQQLNSYPTVATTPNATGLLLTQPGINPKMITLAQYADLMAKAQNGTLTPDQAELLQGMAAELMQELTSPTDMEILKKWMETTLANFPLKQPPSTRIFSEAMLFGASPTHNPYMEPGIMAMLAPILSELFVIYTDIIKQSSKLKQNMFKLTIAMAKEAYQFAIAAGQAKAQQLQNDADKFMAMGITMCVQAGLQLGAFAGQKIQGRMAAQEHKDGYAIKGGTNVKGKAITPEAEARLARSEHVNRAETSSGFYFANQMINTLGGAVSNFVQSAYTAKNVEEVMDEAQNNAMKEMISQLMGLIQQTIQSSSDEMAAAQKAWEGFIQLYKDFAQTITQGIYRS